MGIKDIANKLKHKVTGDEKGCARCGWKGKVGGTLLCRYMQKDREAMHYDNTPVFNLDPECLKEVFNCPKKNPESAVDTVDNDEMTLNSLKVQVTKQLEQIEKLKNDLLEERLDKNLQDQIKCLDNKLDRLTALVDTKVDKLPTTLRRRRLPARTNDG